MGKLENPNHPNLSQVLEEMTGTECDLFVMLKKDKKKVQELLKLIETVTQRLLQKNKRSQDEE